MSKDGRWLFCPFCGWGKKYITDKRINTLNRIHVRDGAFIDHRDMSGGRGSGFPRVSIETLSEIKDLPEYSELIAGLRQQCREVLDIIGVIE